MEHEQQIIAWWNVIKDEVSYTPTCGCGWEAEDPYTFHEAQRAFELHLAEVEADKIVSMYTK